MGDNPTAGTLRAQVFNCVYEAPAGRTAQEVADIVGLSPALASARLTELATMSALVTTAVSRAGWAVYIVASRQPNGTELPHETRHAVQARALGIDALPPRAQVTTPSAHPGVVEPDNRPVAADGQQPSYYIAVDGKNVLYRLYHAAKKTGDSPRLKFQLALADLRDTYQPPGGVIVAWDSEDATWRHAEYPAYKGERDPIEPLLANLNNDIHAIVGEVDGVRLIVVPGYEADDILGTLAAQAVAEQRVLTIVTTDKDLYQCVRDPFVEIMDRNREDEHGIVHEAQVAAIWGVGPRCIPDMLALLGDKADNLPGITGIGKKTAPGLLAKHGSLDGVIRAAEAGTITGKRRERILDDAARARQMLRLATLTTNVPGVALSSSASDNPPPPPRLSYQPSPEDIDMAKVYGWRWSRPTDPKKHKPPRLEGEPLDRWERDDGWGYMAADETDGRWFHVHRSDPETRHDAGTDDIGKALSAWHPVEAAFRALNPAAPDEWSEDWSTRETSVSLAHIPQRVVIEGVSADTGLPVREVLTLNGPEPVVSEHRYASGLPDRVYPADPPSNTGTITVSTGDDCDYDFDDCDGEMPEGMFLAREPGTSRPVLYDAVDDNVYALCSGCPDPVGCARAMSCERRHERLEAEPFLAPVPDDNPARGLAMVLAMWARHALTGRPQMLVWEVDLKVDAGEQSPLTALGYTGHDRDPGPLTDIIPRMAAKLALHRHEEKGARVGLLVSANYMDGQDGERGYRFGAVPVAERVNVAHIANKPVPLGRWAIVAQEGFDSVRPAFDLLTFMQGIPF